MDIYFENFTWIDDGKIDNKSSVRWTDTLTGEVIFEDYKSFLEKWHESPLYQKQDIRLFIASKQLMSVREANKIKLDNITPIRFGDFFPSIYELIYKKKPNFFLDCSGQVLKNFKNVLTDLDIKNSKVYSLGLGINWEENTLTIYPGKNLITIRYGISDFVSFSMDKGKEKFFVEEQLNIFINSLGAFEKIKVIKNNGYEKLIENSSLNFKQELVALKTNKFLPELIIDKNYLNPKKILFRMFNLALVNASYFLKIPNASSFLIPIIISITGLFIISLYDDNLKTNTSIPSSYPNNDISTKSGSLVFFNSFINQSTSLTKKNVKSIELDVKQQSNNMIGGIKIVLNMGNVKDYNGLLAGISSLAKDAKIDKKNSTIFFTVNYLFKNTNQVMEQNEIIIAINKLLKYYEVKKNVQATEVITQSENRVKVTLKNQKINKINNFLVGLKQSQSGWEWVSLRFIKNDIGLTSFYGTLELLDENN